MGTRRYCGSITIYVDYNDVSGGYLCRVVLKDGNGKKHAEPIFVRQPQALTNAVDSPIEYTSAASAALSFLGSPISSEFDTAAEFEDAKDFASMIDDCALFGDTGWSIRTRAEKNAVPVYQDPRRGPGMGHIASRSYSGVVR